MNRKDILLRAAFDMIRKAESDQFVRSPLEITTFYDDADATAIALLTILRRSLKLTVNHNR